MYLRNKIGELHADYEHRNQDYRFYRLEKRPYKVC